MHVFHIEFIFRQSLRLAETLVAFLQNLVPFAEVPLTSAFPLTWLSADTSRSVKYCYLLHWTPSTQNSLFWGYNCF